MLSHLGTTGFIPAGVFPADVGKGPRAFTCQGTTNLPLLHLE